MATPKQINFIQALQGERGVPVMTEAALSAVAVGDASKLISDLMKLPKIAVHAAADGVTIEDGYYAVEYGGRLNFYRVKHGRKGGRWENTQFINRYASDNLLRPDRVEKSFVKSAIADDAETARQRFARELGRCYACGRTLTDEKSRRLGIGPDCRGER